MAVRAVQASERKARILIVEDEGIIARDIRQTLEDLGYAVTGEASSGLEAVELCSKAQPDLVLMDVRIHGEMDGIEAAQAIRRNTRVPIVYLTAHADVATVERAKLTQPFGYIVKPFTSNDLRITIEIALQRYELQREIEDRDAWSSAVLRSIGDAVIVSRSDGLITFFNTAAAELVGIHPSLALGRKLEDTLRIETSPNATASNGPDEFAIATLTRMDGSTKLVVRSSAPLMKGEDGDAEGTVTILRDVSDLRKTETALRESNWFLQRSNESLTQLSHSLSHDLQEPLRTVSCYSAMLARQPELSRDERSREYLTYIQNGCTRMADLLSSLLDYYRAAAEGTTAAVAVQPERCLKQAMENLAVAIADSGAEIRYSSLPSVCFHPTALVQVFQNLIANSIKYRSARRPEIIISANHQGPICTFTVADNGMGFNPLEAGEIFDLFKRGSGTDRPGNGIGLAMCRKLVEQYQGTIWAESNPNEGSRFYFSLQPVAQES